MPEPNTPDTLEPFREHASFTVVDLLSSALRIDPDLVVLMEYLSLIGGAIGRPIHLDIHSDQLAADLHLANWLLDLEPERTRRVDTYRQFRTLEDNGFGELITILVRGHHPFMFRNFTEYTARLSTPETGFPSIWRIADCPAPKSATASTLRLATVQTERGLDGLAAALTDAPKVDKCQQLNALIDTLPDAQVDLSSVRPNYLGRLACADTILLERLLQIIVAVRASLAAPPLAPHAADLQDYFAICALLTNLPLTPEDRLLSPQALMTAETLYDAVQNDQYQLSLPDHSREGNKWFTRSTAVQWTELSYNTVKKHLIELENEGLVVPTIAETEREHGRQIHYRFRHGKEPPFRWRNPFEKLLDAYKDNSPQ